MESKENFLLSKNDTQMKPAINNVNKIRILFQHIHSKYTITLKFLKNVSSKSKILKSKLENLK